MDFVSLDGSKLRVNFESHDLKQGVSGLMRVRDDAEFVAASIESCIDALDELIIVYNDCTDNTPEIVKQKAQEYPDKIRVYEYPWKVYSINLSKDEYEYVNSLPLDSPHRLCNYYNFALSKVKYKHAIKIDADQIYFTDKLKYWCDTYRADKVRFTFKVAIGSILGFYVISKLKKSNEKNSSYLYHLQSPFLRACYYSFVKYFICKNPSINVSLSGVNLFMENDCWYVPLGGNCDNFQLLPAFNGVGDHLIFTIDNNAFYFPANTNLNNKYSKMRSDIFTSIEVFNKTGHTVSIGTLWFHMNCMREGVREKNSKIMKQQPDRFMALSIFEKCNFYKDLRPRLDLDFGTNLNLFQFLQVYKNVDYVSELNKIFNRGNTIK